jgi:signal transduction histidine kinase
VERYPLIPGSDHVYVLYEAPSHPGTLWAGTGGSGLVAFDTHRRTVLRQFPTPTSHREGDAPVWALAEARDDAGTLWITTHGAGLLQLDLQTATLSPAARAPDCPLPDTLYALAPASDGLLWIGAMRDGLFRYDRHTGACQRVAPDDDLPTDVVALFVDDRGRVWMSTQTRGLARYAPESGTFTRFSTADGLQSETFYVPARHQSPSGQLFFGGADGFNAFHPDSVFIDTTPPPVVLTRVLVDGEPYPLVRDSDGYRPLTLRHDQRDLAFEFAALDLRAPEKNRYRVQLDGAEDTPRYIGPQTSERYPFLSPGRYTFRVTGTNADGVWNPEGAALAFTIRPPLWQTWYFWTLIAAAVLGLVVTAYQFRIRQLVRLENTRRRIADDLHDDIGSKIGSVALRLDLAGRNPSLPDTERARLAELSDAARGVVGDLRDAVWFVDASHDDLPALVARLEQFAQAILRGRPHRFDRPDALPPVALDMDTRRHLYLLAKEALHNAARHSAGPVEVNVAYDAPGLQITVADAGPGFDPAAVGAGRGLRTMRARADALGGMLAVESTPEAGTTVRVTLDIA